MRSRMGVVSTAFLVLLSGCAMGSWVWSKPGITIAISTVILMILIGCAMSSWDWSKRGITLAQGEKDMAECSEKANLLNIYGDKYDDEKFFVAGSVVGQDPVKPGIIFKNCMEAKGYKRSKPGS